MNELMTIDPPDIAKSSGTLGESYSSGEAVFPLGVWGTASGEPRVNPMAAKVAPCIDLVTPSPSVQRSLGSWRL